MKYYYFFYEQFDLGKLETHINKNKTYIDFVNENGIAPNHQPVFNLNSTPDYSSYNYYDFNNDKISHKFNLVYDKKYESWRETIIVKLVNDKLSDKEIDKLKKKLKSYKKLCQDKVGLYYLLEKHLDDYISHLVEHFSPKLKSSDFKVPKKNKHKTIYLPKIALSDLQKIFNFEKKTITNDIDEKSWTLYFIGKIKLNEEVRLKVSTELISLMLDALAKKYLKRGQYGHFYRTIESDEKICTSDGTPLSESNIKKSASDVIRFRFIDESKRLLLERINQCIPD